MEETKAYLTNKEAAAYIRTSEITLWRIRKEGELPYYRLQKKILFKKDDLDAYLTGRRRLAAA